MLVAAFLAGAVAWLAAAQLWPAGPALRAAGWALTGIGLLAVFAVDRIYAVLVPVAGRAAAGRSRAVGPVLVGSLWLAGLLAGIVPVALTAAAWKAWFDLGPLRGALGSRGRTALVIIRVLLGLALPAALLVLGGPRLAGAAALLAVAGEGIERALFYQALRVTTPRLELAAALARELAAEPGKPARAS